MQKVSLSSLFPVKCFIVLMPLCRHGTTHTHAKKDTSTTNLKNHAKRCDMKVNSSKSQQLRIDEVLSQYTVGEFHLLHVEWMTELHCSNYMIKDPGFKESIAYSTLQCKSILTILSVKISRRSSRFQRNDSRSY